MTNRTRRSARDVLQRVAVHGDEVGLQARRERADLLAEPHRFRGERGRADDRVHRALAAVLARA